MSAEVTAGRGNGRYRRDRIAVAELRHLLDGSQVWHVPRCCYCRRPHDYAAGQPGDDPREYLGARLSLCPRARWLLLAILTFAAQPRGFAAMFARAFYAWAKGSSGG